MNRPSNQSVLLLVVGVVLGCGSGDPVTPTIDGDLPDEEPALVDVAFTEDPADVLSPERGFYAGVDLRGSSDFAGVRAGGMTLAIASIHLDAYRDAPLDAGLLDELTAGFARVRAAGIKVILRFAYNSGPIGAPDAPLARIQEHVAQLAPVIAANADVIALMQAGFIGAWGEWHNSTNGLETTPNRLAVVTALLDALPATRAVGVRAPDYVDEMFPGGALTDGFDGSPRSRVGHHNDCFLASTTDFGTYPEPVDPWKDYVAADARFTPMGGETCNVEPARTDCPSATAELERLHFTYLNSDYHQGVLDGWIAQGCMPEIVRRLGYRLVVESARHSERVKPGGRLRVEVALRNDGYAAPFNARPLRVVLDAGTTRRVATLVVDVRRWLPGAQAIATTLRVPSNLPPGPYRLSLWLPDPDLEARPEYAVRFANTDVFDADTGLAVLVPALVVDPSAPGESVADATELVEL